jgi:hypothetical protein
MRSGISSGTFGPFPFSVYLLDYIELTNYDITIDHLSNNTLG